MPSFSKWHTEVINLGYQDSRTPAERTRFSFSGSQFEEAVSGPGPKAGNEKTAM